MNLVCVALYYYVPHLMIVVGASDSAKYSGVEVVDCMMESWPCFVQTI